MKKYIYLIISLTLIISLSSCGKEKEETPEYVRPDVFAGYNDSTLVFNADGSILEIAMQDYNNSGVDYSGLKSYVESEIDAANKKLGSENISMTDFFDDSGVVKAAIHYTYINSYNVFNGTSYEMSGYDPEKCNISVPLSEMTDASLTDASLSDADFETIEATFTDASDNSVVRSSDISKSYMMLTIDNRIDVRFEDGNILYYNKYARRNTRTIECSGDGMAVIVFEFNYAY